MQANPIPQTQHHFEFRFVSMLASHANGDADTSELRALDDLGHDGWQIRAVTADPALPTARLLIALQRELS